MIKADLDLSVCPNVRYLQEQDKYEMRQGKMDQSILINKENIPKLYWHFNLVLATIWGCIMKIDILKKIIPKVEYIKKNNIRWSSDTIMMLEYIKYCENIGVYKEPLYAYRISELNTTTVRTFDNYRFRAIDMFITELKSCCDNGILEKNDKAIVNNYLWQIMTYFEMIQLSNLTIEEQLEKYIEVFKHKYTYECFENRKIDTFANDYKNKFLEVIIFITKHGTIEDKKLLEDTLKLL